MMPYLGDFDCVAVDLPGHGGSVHREPNALYHYIDYVRDINLIIDALGWSSCHILGHSMGGALGLMAASAFASKVKTLTMIDILHPLHRSPEEGPAMLSKSLGQFEQWDPARQTVFPTLEHAVRARLAAAPFDQDEQAMRLIMEYATKPVEGGYQLTRDSRLTFASPIMLDGPQVNAFVAAVEQPVLALFATRGIMQNRDLAQTLGLFQNIQVDWVEGTHHVHMEQPEAVTDIFRAFIAEATRKLESKVA